MRKHSISLNRNKHRKGQHVTEAQEQMSVTLYTAFIIFAHVLQLNCLAQGIPCGLWNSFDAAAIRLASLRLCPGAGAVAAKT